MPRPGVEFINPTIRASAAAVGHKINPALRRLQWNENPYDFPADLKEEVLQQLGQIPWSRYPLGGRAYDLMEALAAFHNVDAGQVVVGAGSSDLLPLVIGAVLSAGDHMVVPTPTFQAYRRHALVAGATVHEIPLDPAADFALPVDELLAQADRHRAKLIVVCAPNNPTGTVYAPSDLRRIVAESDAFVMIDAAYGEFIGQDLRPLLAEFDNVAVVHTFSKAFALAGARIGYVLAAPSVAAELQKLVTSFTLSPFSETAAIVALRHFDRFRSSVERIVAERERLAANLAALPGVHVFSSGTNFLFVRLPRPAAPIHSELLHRHGLLVSLPAYPGYENYLRISVGAPADNELLVTALADHLAGQPV